MANHINAAQNLTKKGAAANPNGRPKKGYSITEWFQNMFAEKPEVKEAIGTAIVKKALEGDATAQKLVWNYMDGMPAQKLEHGGEIKFTPLLKIDEIRRNNSDPEDPGTPKED